MRYITILFLFFSPLWSQERDFHNSKKDNIEKHEKLNEVDNVNMTQRKIRQLRRIETSFGQSFFKDSQYQCEEFKIQFNVSSRFSIGASYHYFEKFSGAYLAQPSDFSNNPEYIIQSYGLYRDVKDLGILNIRYFPLEEIPFYLTGGVGKNFSDYQETTFFFTTINKLEITQIRNRDTFPSYSYFGGFGFQWLFKNGLLIGAEAFALQSINSQKNQHTVTLASSPSPLYNEILLSSILSDKLNSHEISSYSLVYNIRVGYSF